MDGWCCTKAPTNANLADQEDTMGRLTEPFAILAVCAITACTGEFSEKTPAGAAATDVRRLSTMINDDHPSIIYSAKCCSAANPWNHVTVVGDYLGDETNSNQARTPDPQVTGASAVVNFFGTDITWIGRMGRSFGMARYAVDDGEARFVDLYYDGDDQFQVPLVTIPGLNPGSHALEIDVTPNTSGTDYLVAIDAFSINGSPLTLDQASLITWQTAVTGPEMTSWFCGEQPGNIGGGFCYTFDLGATWSGSFNGSLFELFGHPDAEDGTFEVKLDGSHYAYVNAQFGDIDDDLLSSTPFLIGRVDPGDHTIEVVNLSGGLATQIDSVVAFP
jgi:hypothetical protein